MNKLKLMGAVIGIIGLGVTAANAAPGFSTANVNMRTGPDLNFPAVEIIPEATQVEVEGCLADESWCDVIVGPNRGWVFSEYIAFDRGGQYVLLPDVGIQTLKIPSVTFVANDYWTRHYVGRPWFAERDKWIAFKPHPRPGWIAPPPGRRVAGWWRTGYKPPEVGLVIPQEHWKHPHR